MKKENPGVSKAKNSPLNEAPVELTDDSLRDVVGGQAVYDPTQQRLQKPFGKKTMVSSMHYLEESLKKSNENTNPDDPDKTNSRIVIR